MSVFNCIDRTARTAVLTLVTDLGIDSRHPAAFFYRNGIRWAGLDAFAAGNALFRHDELGATAKLSNQL